jgi:hypothetical protein
MRARAAAIVVEANVTRWDVASPPACAVRARLEC